MNEINEITVWLDQLEDEGQDVSLMRLLCSYNFLSPFIGDRDVTHFCANTFGNGYAWDYATYWGNGNGNMVEGTLAVGMVMVISTAMVINL